MSRTHVCSVQLLQFSSFSSDHELFRPWLGLTWLARVGSGSIQSNESLVVWEEQFKIPPAEIPDRRPGVCCLGGAMVRFAGCACLLVRDVVDVGVTQIQINIA